MNLRREMRTDRRLWVVFGAVAFVLLGFVDPLGGRAYRDLSYWAQVSSAVREMEPQDAVAKVAACTVSVTICAAVIGWLAQAVVVVVRTRQTPEKVARPPY
jgi:hypothetical protein